MNFGNIVIMMSKFGSKSGDFAQRGTDDVAKIAKNFGVAEYVIGKAKQNWWIKERLVLTQKTINGIDTDVFSVGRFSKSSEDIKEWENAIDNIFNHGTKKDFLYTIAHEYIEGELIDKYGVNFMSFNKHAEYEFFSYGAHELAPIPRDPKFNSINPSGYWNAGKLNQKIFPKPNDDLSNLDEIVEKIAQFYNLK